jgi:hypothetical protein
MEKPIRGWKDKLICPHRHVGDLFARSEVRRRRLAHPEGLLGGCERKNRWHVAECVGDASPYGVQYLRGRARWDADALQARLNEYVQANRGSPGAVLILKEAIQIAEEKGWSISRADIYNAVKWRVLLLQPQHFFSKDICCCILSRSFSPDRARKYSPPA